MAIVTFEELINDLIEEAKKTIGIRRFKWKKIKWQWEDPTISLKTEHAHTLIIKPVNKKNYVVYFPTSFMNFNWTSLDDDDNLVDEISFDNEENPDPKYKECHRINEAWLKDVMITILYEFMHIANWKIPDHEVYRTSEQFAKQYIQKNNIVKSTFKTAYR